MNKSDIVAQARKYLGTAYAHQGCSAKNLDCIGLIKKVLTDLNYNCEAWSEYDGYSNQPDGKTIIEGCNKYLTLCTKEMEIGDIAVVSYGFHPQHLAFVCDYRHGGFSIIHSINYMGVVEHRLDNLWKKRIVARYEVSS